MVRTVRFALLPILLLLAGIPRLLADEMPRIVVSEDGKGFVFEGTDTPFRPHGFNYDHDRDSRLIEDYWTTEWPMVEEDFAEMRALGANVVRVHLQLGKFMTSPDEPNAKALDQLTRLLKLAESERLYLDITGLGCYHKQDVPEWYDALDEPQRWEVQARFWQAVAERGAKSPAVFCYDLMNEPVVPGGKRENRDWLGPGFGDKHFVQFITLDQQGRPRHEIARAWIEHLTKAVREVDDRHLITVGMVHWSLDRPGLSSGFVPSKVAASLDFIAVHIYPETGKLDEAATTLEGFDIGKPVVVEETFPLRCSPKDLAKFVRDSPEVAGWISFYWGETPEELAERDGIGPALQREWLRLFMKDRAPEE